MAEEALITVGEAQEVITHAGFPGGRRTLMMIVVGTISVICAVLFVMLLLSFRGAKTGLSAIFPFLEKQENQTLQIEP